MLTSKQTDPLNHVYGSLILALQQWPAVEGTCYIQKF
jgi:hypothetical protein